MTSEEKQARVDELHAEIRALQEFIKNAESGAHDDEAALMTVPANLREQARRLRRMTLMQNALNRIKDEIYPEIHRLDFEIQFGQ